MFPQLALALLAAKRLMSERSCSSGLTVASRTVFSSLSVPLTVLCVPPQVAVVPGRALRLPQPAPDPRPAAAPAGGPHVAAGSPQGPPGAGRRPRRGFLPPVLQRRRRRGAGPLVLPEGPHAPVHGVQLCVYTVKCGNPPGLFSGLVFKSTVMWGSSVLLQLMINLQVVSQINSRK